MSTVNQIILDAMFAAGVLGQDQGAGSSNDDIDLVRRRLVRMIASWRGLMLYTTKAQTFTMTAGDATYTTATWTDGRPVSILNIYVTHSGVDYPTDEVGQEEYDAIPVKTSRGMPKVWLNDTAYPTATITFYPTPDKAYTVTVNGMYPVTSSLALSDTLSLPEGYEAAIVDNLAVDICPSFGVQPAPTLVMSARAAKRALKMTNFVPSIMSLTGADSDPGYIRILGDT